MNDRPHYPWNQGDELFAEELNAAIANSGAYGPFVPLHANSSPVNVLDFGADPTGATDSTAAFNAAIASRAFNNAEVYIPLGRYTLTDAVTLGAGCVIQGAGRNLTLIQINTSFNMSAQGVFVFGSDPAHSGTPTIKDLWIRFTQPNFAGMTRADLIHYPPAIYKAAATATGRPNLENLMITSAWIGMYLDNCAAYLNNIYMSALGYGFQWSATTPTLDCVRISNVHFWGFDFLDQPAWTVVHGWHDELRLVWPDRRPVSGQLL